MPGVLNIGSPAPGAELLDEAGGPCAIPRPGRSTLLIFYRGDWCPWCNGQLASLARLEGGMEALGAEVVGVSVDPPERNRQMRTKLRLPFRLLSDPGGTGAIDRYGAWSAEEGLARPSVVVVDRDGIVRYAQRGEGFADRVSAEAMLAAVEACAR